MSEEKILHRIQKLIDKAISTTNPHEEKLFMDKAEALMMQHSIDEITLQERRKDQPSIFSQEPEWRDISIWSGESSMDYEFLNHLTDLFNIVARHWGVRCRGDYSHGARTAKCVGFPADLDLTELMWTSIKLHAISSLNPQVDGSLPWTDVMATLKETGLKWKDVHDRLWAHPSYPFKDMPWERKFGVRFTSEYKKIADRDERERVSTSSPETWREDYIFGYVSKIRARLHDARTVSVESNSNLPALIRDKGDAITEAWYLMFPAERPHLVDCQCENCVANRSYWEAASKLKPRKVPMARGRYRNNRAVNSGSSRAASANLGGSSVSSSARKEVR